MIPAPDTLGELPAGVHTATWAEVVAVLGTTPRRRVLCAGLRRALANLQAAGVRRVFLDGSFVTTKAEPHDIDGCWEWTAAVDVQRLDPVLLDFTHGRQAMQEKYGVDFFLATWVEAGSGLTFLDFFQRNRADAPKGMLALHLGEPL